MCSKDDFNLFVGGDNGIFKGVKAYHGQALVKNIQSLNHLSKENNVRIMSWNSDNEDNVLLGLSNQFVKVYDTNDKTFTCSTSARVVDRSGFKRSKGEIVGISEHNGALVTAFESGQINISGYGKNHGTFFSIGKNLRKMRHSKWNPNVIGTGGFEHELKLYDINTRKKIFQAKNVPDDPRLQLRSKIWITDLAFLPSSDKLVVGSRYGYVRLYDPKAQKSPVMNLNLPDQAVTCIAATNQENTVVCGLAKGNIIAVDLRKGKKGKQGKAYRGFLGAVSDIACHPTQPYIASVSLDRFLRVHHAVTKELLVKEYMVTRLNCVIMRSNFSLDSVKTEYKGSGKRLASDALLSEDESDDEEDLDEISHSMIDVSRDPDKKSWKADSSPSVASTVSAQKKAKLLVMNPFAKKDAYSKQKAENTSVKKKLDDSVKEIVDDSDDDIMIVSETVVNTTEEARKDANESDSEPDEADGESDEFDDDLDDDDVGDDLDDGGSSEGTEDSDQD